MFFLPFPFFREFTKNKCYRIKYSLPIVSFFLPFPFLGSKIIPSFSRIVKELFYLVEMFPSYLVLEKVTQDFFKNTAMVCPFRFQLDMTTSEIRMKKNQQLDKGIWATETKIKSHPENNQAICTNTKYTTEHSATIDDAALTLKWDGVKWRDNHMTR